VTACAGHIIIIMIRWGIMTMSTIFTAGMFELAVQPVSGIVAVRALAVEVVRRRIACVTGLAIGAAAVIEDHRVPILDIQVAIGTGAFIVECRGILVMAGFTSFNTLVAKFGHLPAIEA